VATERPNQPLRCGELARLAGISPDTIRYYERSGLMPPAPRSTSGYRLFPLKSIVRVKSIRSALSIGLSVRELREIFSERNRGGAPSKRVRRLVGDKLRALESRIRDLTILRRQMSRIIAEWDSVLRDAPQNKQARNSLDKLRPGKESVTREFPLGVGAFKGSHLDDDD